jgi:hypothetical protein
VAIIGGPPSGEVGVALAFDGSASTDPGASSLPEWSIGVAASGGVA